jgi:hypothetical protein
MRMEEYSICLSSRTAIRILCFENKGVRVGDQIWQ